MFEGIRDNLHQLRDGTAGRRFTEYYEARHERRQSESSLGRIAVIAGGVILLLGGLAIGWLPGPGGFISIFGAALLATEYRPLARLLDRAEQLGRRIWRYLREWWRRSSAAARAMAVVVVVVVMAGLAWGAGSAVFG